MRRVVQSFVLLAAVLRAGHAMSGPVVNPGGTIRDLVADPVRPVFYATVDTGDLVTIDVGSASVTGRLPLPGVPGAITVASDGSRLWVALTDAHDIALVPLPASAVAGTISLSMPSGPTDVEAGATRLYAVSDDGLSIVDIASASELWFGRPGAGIPDTYHNLALALSPDGETLYGMSRFGSGTQVFAYEVCDDVPHPTGQCRACPWGNSRVIAPAPDGSRLYAASASPYHIVVLEVPGMLVEVGSIPAGMYPNAFAISRDGTRAFLAPQVRRELLIADTRTSLAFHAEALQDDVFILALSSDERTVAAGITVGSVLPTRVELVDVSTPAPNRGGVRLRPIDTVTGATVEGAEASGLPTGEASWIDLPRGVLGYAPCAPGTWPVTVTAAGYATRTLSPVTVTAGAWTDLGDVPLTRTGWPDGPFDLGVTPWVDAGTTRSVVLHGRGFLPGTVVTARTSEFTLDRANYRDESRIDLVLTTLPGATVGYRAGALQVDLPDGRFATAPVFVRDPACPALVRPPNPIPVLYAAKAPPADVRLEWDDSAVDGRHDAATTYLVFRSTTRPDAGFASLPDLADSPVLREAALDPGALVSGPPLSALHFYQVSARNSAGDSGDLP